MFLYSLSAILMMQLWWCSVVYLHICTVNPTQVRPIGGKTGLSYPKIWLTLVIFFLHFVHFIPLSVDVVLHAWCAHTMGILLDTTAPVSYTHTSDKHINVLFGSTFKMPRNIRVAFSYLAELQELDYEKWLEKMEYFRIEENKEIW